MSRESCKRDTYPTWNGRVVHVCRRGADDRQMGAGRTDAPHPNAVELSLENVTGGVDGIPQVQSRAKHVFTRKTKQKPFALNQNGYTGLSRRRTCALHS